MKKIPEERRYLATTKVLSALVALGTATHDDLCSCTGMSNKAVRTMIHRYRARELVTKTSPDGVKVVRHAITAKGSALLHAKRAKRPPTKAMKANPLSYIPNSIFSMASAMGLAS